MAKNEFEELDVDDVAPKPEVSEVVGQTNQMIAAGSAGIVYDWTQAPEGVKAPPRIDLSGKIVTIKKAEIILPPLDRPWDKTKSGDKEYKYCTFILFYDEHGQQETYSGVRVFKRDEEGQAKYSHPTFPRDRKSQASRLLGAYADYKKKDINEVNLKEFMNFLNSQPKARIMKVSVLNPTTNSNVDKNIVQEFINP